MSSTSKIVLDGDSTGYVASQKRAQGATRQTAREAATIGTEIQKSTVNLAKMVLAAGALASAAKSYSTAMAEARKASADAQRNMQGTATDIERAALAPVLGPNGIPIAPGMTPAQAAAAAAMLDFPGARTRAETAGFVRKVIDRPEGRRPGVLSGLRGAFASGLYEEDELLAGMRFGRIPSADEIEARRAALTPESRAELDTRVLESRADDVAKRIAIGAQERARLVDVLTKLIDAAMQQQGLSQFAESIPIMKDGFGLAKDLLAKAKAGEVVDPGDLRSAIERTEDIIKAFEANAAKASGPTGYGNPGERPGKIVGPRQSLPTNIPIPQRGGLFSQYSSMSDSEFAALKQRVRDQNAKNAAENEAALARIRRGSVIDMGTSATVAPSATASVSLPRLPPGDDYPYVEKMVEILEDIRGATRGIPTLRDDKR